MKLLIVLLCAVSALWGCSQAQFPKSINNPITIEQETVQHNDIDFVSAGNQNKGATFSMWRYKNATHPDSVAIWGYAMEAKTRKLFNNIWFVSIDKHIGKESYNFENISTPSGILYKKIKPSTYDIFFGPESMFMPGFEFHDLSLEGGDSLSIIIIVPEKSSNNSPQDEQRKRSFRNRIEQAQAKSYLFKRTFLEYYVNGKKTRQKVTPNKSRNK